MPQRISDEDLSLLISYITPDESDYGTEDIALLDLRDARAELARKAEYSREYLADTDAQFAHLAHKIETLEAALKIAVEALEWFSGLKGEEEKWAADVARDALDRIKQIG